MQREQTTAPQLVLYALLTLALFALQGALEPYVILRGLHVDILPCLVVTAALLGGPVDGAVTGLLVGVLYDLGFNGMEGIYPLLFLAVGLLVGRVGYSNLDHNYLSAALLSMGVLLIIGLLRYFFWLLPTQGASLLLVLRQTVGGAGLAALFGWIAYLPMRGIRRRFSRR